MKFSIVLSGAVPLVRISKNHSDMNESIQIVPNFRRYPAVKLDRFSEKMEGYSQ